ncbi:DUF2092 domain-containing protein [Natrinema zhouii]|uniref:Outer membrane lipoprotein carrier protein LolA n=1 Tax=Natrinema zhouii TaxID=1710539 RepID=A0A7D6CP94_9EURY|nr:outer membrane lipoprotein carrier protein LolA [Natrinema zhouii]QLK25634.1 DUF2092 domain-containing protein [Natrinema zhouii]
MNRRRLLATGAAVALAGCLGDSGDGAPTGTDLVRDAIETRRHMRSLEAKRTVTAGAPEETVERVERIARRPPAEQRIEVLESTDSDVPVGSVTVTNRATTWAYNPSTEVVDKQYHPNKVDTDQTRLVLENLLEYRLGYEGTETVDGREAHVVETKPPVDDIGPKVELVVGDTTYVMPVNIIRDLEKLDVSRTVWIDDEYRYPIKERNTMNEDGETRHELTVTYEDLSIDEGVAPETFTYDPPKGVTVVPDGREPEGVFERRRAAEAHLPYELPEPDVPDAYALDRITIIDREDEYGGTTAMLWYNDPNVVARELYVAVREFQRFSSTSPDVEEIEVDGNTAYRRDGRIQSIFWTCDDLSYEVSSLTDDTPLLEITASIGCS